LPPGFTRILIHGGKNGNWYYNEASTLREILARVRSIQVQKQIVAVDDCSQDDTFAILQAEAEQDSTLTVLRQPRNGGKGSAVRTGLARPAVK
jgi:glycosyltransferase involved in cell wall biosynthesis